MLKNNILYFIKTNPMLNTRRDLIDFLAVAGVNKHRVCGYLSSLKKAGEINIVVQKPSHCSPAY